MADLYQRQQKLEVNKDQSITVVGCGGIGFWVAKLAAMAGIEEMYLFDDDILELHNLNRLDVPDKFLGRNKADIVKLMINQLRPDCTVYTMPWRYNETTGNTGTNWLVDCTDNYKSQVVNQKLTKTFGMKYFKAGYDGEDFSINDKVATWDSGEDDEDGYRVVPSWVVPAVMIASMAVAKIMKYPDKEIHSNILGLFKAPRGSARKGGV
jgi:adenylyltransferase/sulfurtransferase